MVAPRNGVANARPRRGDQPAPPIRGAVRARGRPRTHAARVEPAHVEEFDLEVSADDEEESVPPRARTQVRAPVDLPAVNDDPLLDTANRTSRSSSKAEDIEYFFKRDSGNTVCERCR
jgi:hypothetical protein